MELTLRTARRLESNINMLLMSENTAFTFHVRLLEDTQVIKRQVSKERKVILAKIAVRDELLQLRFLIRTAIAETNVKSGLNQQITTRAYLKQKLEYFQAYSSKVILTDWATVEDEITIKKLRLESATGDLYGGVVRATTGVQPLIERDLKEFKKVIKEVTAQIQVIDDNLLILNSTNKITLTEEQVKLLTKVDLI